MHGREPLDWADLRALAQAVRLLKQRIVSRGKGLAKQFESAGRSTAPIQGEKGFEAER
jgi:hypothetical protein